MLIGSGGLVTCRNLGHMLIGVEGIGHVSEGAQGVEGDIYPSKRNGRARVEEVVGLITGPGGKEEDHVQGVPYV